MTSNKQIQINASLFTRLREWFMDQTCRVWSRDHATTSCSEYNTTQKYNSTCYIMHTW